jgi:exonuclease III
MINSKAITFLPTTASITPECPISSSFNKIFNSIGKYFIKGRTNWTFWGYRGGGWQKGNGLRIDHFLTSPEITDLIQSVKIDRNPRGWEKASDHTPVILEIND